MRFIRLYLPQPYHLRSELLLENEAFHHAIHVLRGKVGDSYFLFDGKDTVASTTLLSIARHSAILLIKSVQKQQLESPLNTILIQCVSKGERMDYTLQKSTELGITAIQPVLSERCNVQLDEKRWLKRQKHWQSIIISACEQCGRNTLPRLLPLVNLPQALATLKDQYALFLLHQQQSQNLRQWQKQHEHFSSLGFIAGPEGGFSESEVEMVKQFHIPLLSLGPRILRSETAGITALTVAQATWGDL